MYESFSSPLSLPIFGIISHFNFSHSSGYIMVSYCAYNFHFCDDYWRRAHFKVIIGHSYIFF